MLIRKQFQSEEPFYFADEALLLKEEGKMEYFVSKLRQIKILKRKSPRPRNFL